MSNKPKINTLVFVLVIFWTSVICSSLAWDYFHLKQQTIEMVTIEARAYFKKDQATRRWANSHGGVYVPPDERTPPNPYLSHLPNRDAITTNGTKLTLMNPAYMMRQMLQEFSDSYVVSHITSLKLLNPDNAPDDWEKMSLENFEQGRKETVEISEVEGKPYLRLMQPLITVEGCLKCHGFQGYKIGDIRGGISVSISLSPALEIEKKHIYAHVYVHLIIWIIGLIGLSYMAYSIRKRKEADEASRRSEERFRKSIKYSPLPTVIANSSGEIEYINDRFTEVLGYTIEDVRYPEQWWASAYPDENYRKDVISRWEKATENASAKGEDIVVDTYDVTCKNGTVLTMEIWGSPIDGNNLIILQDITERIKSVKELIENKERLSKINDATFEGILFSKKGIIIDANNQFAAMMGYELEELLGMKIMTLIAQQDREMVIGKLKESNTLPYEILVVKKDGSFINVEARGRTTIQEGSGLRISAIRDITDRKKAEKSLRESEIMNRSLLEGSPVCTKIIDLDFKLQYMSSAGQKDLKIPDIKPYYGQTYPLEFFPESMRAPLIRGVKEAMAGKTTTVETPAHDLEGNAMWYFSTFVPVLDDDGRVKFIISTSVNITERKNAEKKIISSLKEKEVLLKEVHHRVKNNMAVISSLLSLQSEYVEDKKYIDMFEESQDRIRSMALVHERLYKTEYFTDINVQEYVNSLVRNIKSSYVGNKDIALTIEVHDVYMNIDNLVPLGLIMNEILTNVFKHAFKGQEDPCISLTMQKDNDNYITMTISDNGIGLPKDFDIPKSKSLGLKLIQILSEQIEGKLDIISDNGTTFKLTFPETIQFARKIPDNG